MDHFEGPEKKLEILFSQPLPQLRGNEDGRWDRVVQAGGAEILQGVRTAAVDAYLLSESSLFVWDNRLVMITCGRTTPALALPEILKLVDPERVAGLFYERKNLNFPGRQPTDFAYDRNFLSDFFPEGRSFLFGDRRRDHLHLFYYSRKRPVLQERPVLRVLMNDIDPHSAVLFSRASGPDTIHSEALAKLSCFDENLLLDNYFFHPQGYSLNGVSNGHYVTIHVTPESPASYSSLETTLLDEHRCGAIIGELTSIFKPRRFSAFLKSSCEDPCRRIHGNLPHTVDGFQPVEVVERQLDPACQVTFANFQRDEGFT